MLSRWRRVAPASFGLQRSVGPLSSGLQSCDQGLENGRDRRKGPMFSDERRKSACLAGCSRRSFFLASLPLCLFREPVEFAAVFPTGSPAEGLPPSGVPLLRCSSLTFVVRAIPPSSGRGFGVWFYVVLGGRLCPPATLMEGEPVGARSRQVPV